MDPWIANAVGAGAALCSMASFAPQVVKLWREKDASAIWLRTYAVTVAGFSLWVAYGALLKSWPLTESNGVCVALSAAILALNSCSIEKRTPNAGRRSSRAIFASGLSSVRCDAAFEPRLCFETVEVSIQRHLIYGELSF